jgi:hypothetical protein
MKVIYYKNSQCKLKEVTYNKERVIFRHSRLIYYR